MKPCMSFARLLDDDGAERDLPKVAPEILRCWQYTGGRRASQRSDADACHSDRASRCISLAWRAGALEHGEDPRHLRAAVVSHLRAEQVMLRAAIQERAVAAAAFRTSRASCADIEQKKATTFPGVPTMWIALTPSPELRSGTFHRAVLLLGGAATSGRGSQRFERLTGYSIRADGA